MLITFDQNITREIQAEISEMLRCWEWLVPDWCRRLHVNMWDGTEGEAGETISIRSHYDYREACLNFYTNWLNQPREAKAMQVLHELLHIPLSLIADFARDNFNTLVDKSEAAKYNQTLQEELRVRCESATQDLAYAIFNQYWRP